MYTKPKCSSLDELDSLIQTVSNKARKEFDSLVTNFKINVEQNKKWAASYYSLVQECNKLEKSIKRLKVWRWILIIFLIFPFFLMTNALKKKMPIYEEKCNERDKTKAELDKQLQAFKSELSFDFAFNKIINEAWPDVKLDMHIPVDEYANWQHDYSTYMPDDSCATALVSGRLFQHPFVFMNRKDQRWHPHVYTGSLPVVYTTYSNGKPVTRTQVVVATVTLPEPDWKSYPYLVYRTSKPEKLCFCNNLTKHQAKKAVKKMEHQAMDNPEFDKVFACSRNSETEYRVVFTPSAQEAFVNLFQHKHYGIEKNNEATMIMTESTLIDDDYKDDFNYDINAWRDRYVDWIARLVRQIAIFSLPIANMPIYSQMSYKDHKKQLTPTSIQFQDLANKIFDIYGLWSSFDTDVIFEPNKVQQTTIGGVKFNIVNVTCNYFYPKHETRLIPTPSVKGIVMVPVHVIEYLPRAKNITICQGEAPKGNTKEIIGNGWFIHAGQLISWGWNKIDPKIIESGLAIYKK